MAKKDKKCCEYAKRSFDACEYDLSHKGPCSPRVGEDRDARLLPPMGGGGDRSMYGPE